MRRRGTRVGEEERCMCGGGGEVHVWGWRRGACVRVEERCMCGGGGEVHV